MLRLVPGCGMQKPRQQVGTVAGLYWCDRQLFYILVGAILFGWLYSVLGTVAIHSFSATIDIMNDLGIIFFDVIAERIIYPSLGR